MKDTTIGAGLGMQDTGTEVLKTAGPSPLPVAPENLALVGKASGERGERVDLLAADVYQHPMVWEVYQQGLLETYTALGARHLAPGPELPPLPTTVVLATTYSGRVLGGARLRRGTGLPSYQGLGRMEEAIAEREGEGVDGVAGTWLRPDVRGLGLGEALSRAMVRVSAGTEQRWTVVFANQFNVGPNQRAGFARDERFVDLRFPDERFRSTLLWFDHHRLRPGTELAG